MNMLGKFLREHGLSIFLSVLFIAFSSCSFYLNTDAQKWWQQYLQNLSGDTFGALLIVIATKYLIEKGSAESK